VKIVVFGAAGRTGRKLVSGGVARGHEVTAAARRPKDIRVGSRLQSVVQCDLLDAAQVDAAVARQEVVVVAAGTPLVWAQGAVHSEGIANVITAMRSHAVHRLVCVSAVGTQHDDDPNLPRAFTRVLRPLLLSRIWDELRDMEAQVRGSGLDWTLVHVARLTNGPALGRYRVEEGDTLTEARRISRADVADFILKELERGAWVERDVALAY
jgi:putative NADH-flavin reductase